MLRKFNNIHEGETCVIIGCGPSLKETPRDLLDKYITFGANKIFALYIGDPAIPEELIGFAPTYYTLVDDKMIFDCVPVLAGIDWPTKEIFVRRGTPLPGANFLRVEIRSGISRDINVDVVLGGTVTYVNLQIAAYMGFTTALLVGLDHNYHKYNEKKPGAMMLADGDDDAHFYPGYFTSGHLYAAPELDGVEAHTFPTAKREWEGKGGKIINLTPGTCEKVFERGRFKEWM